MKVFLGLFSLASVLPLTSGKGLWASTAAEFSDVTRQAYPIGNGRLGAMPFGDPGAEKVVLNIDSLWSGGPFEASDYNEGNPTSAVSGFLPSIRQSMFGSGTGDVSLLMGDPDNYGSFQVYANLSVMIDGISSSTKYNRSLDLGTGLHTTAFTGNDGNTYTTTIYCSYPDQVCVYSLSSSAALPEIQISLENQLTGVGFFNATCGNDFVQLAGYTQLGPPVGMKYDGIAKLTTRTGTEYCSQTTEGTLIIPANSHIRTFSLVIDAGTDYSQLAGNAASNYSFQGDDPSSYVESVTSAAALKSEQDLRTAHVADYSGLVGQFTLSLPDTLGSAGTETSVLLGNYSDTTGDPYLEEILFDYGRHLFISAQRDNSFVANVLN